MILLAGPVFTDTVGPVYGLCITIQFSEALSDATATTQSIKLLEGGTQAVLATVVYAGPYRKGTS